MTVPTRAVPRVLSIAGTDPSGGAGIHADLKSIAAAGGYGMAVVTALVAQNTRGVRSVHVPPVSFLTEQLDAVSDDVHIDAVKIGMLGTAEVADTVAAWLDRVRPPVVVLDPVMVATSGDRLLDRAAEQALCALAGRAHLLTPNIPELALLAGEDEADTWPAVLDQAARVSARFGAAVLAKGGHLGGDTAPDALVDASGPTSRTTEFAGARIATTNTHGTGCSLSSGVATRLARTGEIVAAVAASKRWLLESIRHGAALEVGSGHGPVSHFAGLWQRGGLGTRPDAAQVEADWWEHTRPIRADIDALPFVRGLADGTLAPEVFRRYLAQDALYLRGYSRALAAAGSLAPTPDEQAFWAGAARNAVGGELALHTGWLTDDELRQTRPAPATTAYLNHLFARIAQGDYGVLVAAALPCFWLYQDVGTRLRAHSHPDHPYRAWLEAYADEAFARSTRQAIAIVTSAAASSSDADRAAMGEAFRASAAHECAFFAAPLVRGGLG